MILTVILQKTVEDIEEAITDTAYVKALFAQMPEVKISSQAAETIEPIIP